MCVRLRANVVRVKVHLHAEGGVSVGEPEAKGRKRAVIPECVVTVSVCAAALQP